MYICTYKFSKREGLTGPQDLNFEREVAGGGGVQFSQKE